MRSARRHLAFAIGTVAWVAGSGCEGAPPLGTEDPACAQYQSTPYIEQNPAPITVPVGGTGFFTVAYHRPADPNGGGGSVRFEWYRSGTGNPYGAAGSVVGKDSLDRTTVVLRGEGGVACLLEYRDTLNIPAALATDNGAQYGVHITDFPDPLYSRPTTQPFTINTVAATLTVDPFAPQSLSAVPGLTSVTLYWQPDPTATEYVLRRATGGTAPTVVAQVPGPASSFHDVGLSPSTAYTYSIQAVDATHTSTVATVFTRTLDPAVPQPPAPPHGWVTLGGGALSVGDLPPAPALTVDGQGMPIVAFIESLGGDVGRLWVKRFDGTDWTALGGASLTLGSTTSASDPSLLLDPTGEPLVAWSQGDGIQQNVYVARWSSGVRWIAEGVTAPLNLNPGTTAVHPSLALQPNGRAALAWIEDGSIVAKVFLGGFGAATWTTPYGGAPGPVGTGVAGVRLAVDPSGDPIVAYTTGSGGLRDLRVAAARATGWAGIGGAVNFPTAGNMIVRDPFDLHVDGNGVPYVAFGQGISPFAVYLTTWNGAAWTLLGNAVWNSSTSGLQSLVLTRRPGGALTIALSETGTGGGTLRVQDFSGVTWQGLAALGTPVVGDALSLAVTGLRSPIVADVQRTAAGKYALTVRRYYP